MASTAANWFYAPAEGNDFFVTEHLNAGFWFARAVSVYWRCTSSETPFTAEGYTSSQKLTLEWEPGKWVKLSGTEGDELNLMIQAITKPMLGFAPSLTYHAHNGNRVYEWHTDGGDKRWSEVQGIAEFVQPERL